MLELEGRFYYEELKNQFNTEELALFTNMWKELISTVKGFSFLKELEIKQLLTNEILTNRSLRNRKNSIGKVEKLQTQIDEEYLKEPNERDWSKISNLETQSGLEKASQAAYTQEHYKLTMDARDLMKSLKTVYQLGDK